SLRVLTDLHGRVHSSDTVTTTTADQQLAGIGLPSTSAVQNLTVATAGVTYQAPNGVFVGTGVSWYGPSRARDLAYSSDNPAGDYWDWQVRIGYYHRAPRIHTAAPPAPAAGTVAAPAASTPPQNRPPTVRAQCDPCAVAGGTASALTADASDPDGDILHYQWTAASGTLASPTTRQTAWTAPQQAGAVQ